MEHSISEQPLRYNLRKIFVEGYHYITFGDKKFALRPRDRVLVGSIGRLWNPTKFARRVILKQALARKYPPKARMKDGYALYRPETLSPALDAALKVCDDQLATYRRHLAGAPAPEAKAYAAEMAKTLDDPLKHVPYRYDEAAARTLVKLFLSPEIYMTAADYLGMLPVLGGIRILYSPNAEAEALTHAQHFHLDPEGARQAKVFIAIEEVGPENSPLTFVPESLTTRMLRSGHPGFYGKRVADRLVLKHAPKKQWVEHLGKRGDMVFIDTSRCLHFGSRPNSRPRLLLYGQYLDPFASVFPATQPARSIAKTFGFYETQDRIEQHLLGRR